MSIRIVLFLAGIGIGIVIGAQWRSREIATSSVANLSAPLRADIQASTAPAQLDVNRQKIRLGDIANVPFQELYGLLATQSTEEMTLLAQQLKNLAPTPEANTKTKTFFKIWAHIDPMAALAAASVFTQTKGSAIEGVLEGVDPSKAAALAKQISDLPGDALTAAQKTNVLGKAVTKWSQIDPAAAARFLDASNTLQDKSGMAASTWRAVAENWATADPNAAMAWIESHDSDRNKEFALSGAIMGWWKTDARAAESYVASHIDLQSNQQIVGQLVSRMWADDPQRAIAWVDQLSSPEAKDLANVAIAMQTALTDPKRAAEWAANLPDAVRANSLNAVIQKWTMEDPQGAAQYINTLKGLSRDEAIEAYASSTSAIDPTSALNWASTIGSKNIREQSTANIIATWVSRNPEAAKAWIEHSALSDSEKMRLLSLAGSR